VRWNYSLFDAIQQLDDPTCFVLIKAYRSSTDPMEHKKTAHCQTWRDTVAEMMAESRSSVKYSNIFPDDEVGYEALLVHNYRIRSQYVSNCQPSICRQRECYTFTGIRSPPKHGLSMRLVRSGLVRHSCAVRGIDEHAGGDVHCRNKGQSLTNTAFAQAVINLWCDTALIGAEPTRQQGSLTRILRLYKDENRCPLARTNRLVTAFHTVASGLACVGGWERFWADFYDSVADCMKPGLVVLL
jgi:hypothetical protein